MLTIKPNGSMSSGKYKHVAAHPCNQAHETDRNMNVLWHEEDINRKLLM